MVPYLRGKGGSPYHTKGHVGISWELEDVQTTPEKVLSRRVGIWNVRDVKLKFLKYLFSRSAYLYLCGFLYHQVRQ